MDPATGVRAEASEVWSVQDITWTLSDGIGTITLNRPQVRNAFTFPMLREWERMLREARDDDAVKVVVLTGAGDKAFCSGVDLGSISNANPDLTPLERKSQLHDEVHRVARAVADLDKPIIAAINGVAVGAGLDMALMCDLRIMSTSARVLEGYVKVGLTPGDGPGSSVPPRRSSCCSRGIPSTRLRRTASVWSTGSPSRPSSPGPPNSSPGRSPSTHRSPSG